MAASEHCEEELVSQSRITLRSLPGLCGAPRGCSSGLYISASLCRNDGTPSWHETSHGSTNGHAPWPRLSNGHASSRDEAPSPWHER